MQQLLIKMVENIRHFTSVTLINIWTTAEVRQTELRWRVSAIQLASISQRKHVSDERKIRPRQFIWNIGNTTLSELTTHPTPALTPPVKIIKSFQIQVCIYQASQKKGQLDNF